MWKVSGGVWVDRRGRSRILGLDVSAVRRATGRASPASRWRRVEDADGRGRQQEAHDAVSVGTRDQAHVVVQHGAGTMPAAPFVGAVTVRAPEAFSSFTARAYR